MAPNKSHLSSYDFLLCRTRGNSISHAFGICCPIAFSSSTTMYNGIGLTTPRGSGTSGYVVRNLSTLRSYQHSNQQDNSWEAAPPKHREPDQGILEHERKRAVEVKCLELQLKLEDEEIDEAEIEKQVSALREKLLANLSSSIKNPRSLKPSDTHAIAAAKKVELERMAKALGTRSDYQEGDSFDREKQEELKLKRIAEREERERQRAEERRNMEEQRRKWAEERRRQDEQRKREYERSRQGDKRDERGMPPPPVPTGPRRGDSKFDMGPPPPPSARDRDGARDRSPPPRSRDVEMRDRDDRSPPRRSRKRSPSRSPSRSRSPYGRYSKRPARDRSMSPPRRSRSRSVERDRRRRGASYSRSRSRSASRSPLRSPRSRSHSSRSDSRSPSPDYRRRQRSNTPPPSSARKLKSPLPTPVYTRDDGRGGRDYRDRDVPPHLRRGSPPPKGRAPLDRDYRDRDHSPPRRGASPPRGRTPEKRGNASGRGRSGSTGSSMSVSSRSRSGSRD
ncbi:pre-mRNA-splicing factor CWC21 [Coprinopsis cinerea okayama7|uniref:Pre-mRNA-splicing factor CWC21 n=1 Tax=Coprinopsis cinerea (strain Okayama-7 / 130 / ATCC MYA-4618 / FGSC 9003) TaxID=240176 RepID=A8NWM3_COPC7|nr:pre-mRNA-splicing factor CWC21 [Coprinopsis cinerea okayama7\|eukprot:XP_001836931.2 pre-mRNA-splicing factor CWC21 [Coprinopsis cinerea okayama7\